MRVIACLACVLVAAAASARAQDKDPADSLQRVRAALTKPASRLTLTERPPDFTVHIEERRPLQDIFEVPPWAAPAPDFGGFTRPALFAPIEGVRGGFSAPGGTVGVDMLDPARALAKSTARALRVRNARREVQRTLADYCAAQPNFGAAIQVCSTLPPIR
jgi:hypothetical protein